MSMSGEQYTMIDVLPIGRSALKIMASYKIGKYSGDISAGLKITFEGKRLLSIVEGDNIKYHDRRIVAGRKCNAQWFNLENV